MRCVGFIWSWSLEDIGRMGGFFEISLLFSREGGLNALLEGCLWLEMQLRDFSFLVYRFCDNEVQVAKSQE